MARQQVLQIVCSRCTRVELRPLADLQKLEGAVAFTATFMGEKLVYDDLCSACEHILKNYMDGVSRVMTKLSPDHTKKPPAVPQLSVPQKK